MKKFFKLIFGRMPLILFAFILQVTITIILPLALTYYYPNVFGNLFYLLNMAYSVMGIVLTIYLINSDMPNEAQLAWAIILLFFPILGISMYFLFVRRKPHRKHRKLYESVAVETKKYTKKSAEEDENLRAALGDKFGQFQYIYNATDMKAFQNTSVKYLKLGEVFCTELINELKQAKNYIFMEYFIIDEGKLWDSILNILKQKVQEGVEVRVMYDDLGTMNKLPSNYHKKLTKAGIKCVRFNAFGPIVSASHNNRDHRKITIIDGNVGFVSGLNLADEYVNLTHPFGHWKDTGIKLVGDAVKNLVIMFLQLYDVQNQKLEDFSTYFYKGENEQKANGLVCPYGDGPKYFYNEYVASNVYLNLINQAKKYVWITTPYLIIDNKLTNALTSAARRGVDVRIITPHVPDKKIIFSITRSSYHALQKAGVKIFEYAKGFIHSKQVLCDDELGILGTINFDYRSLLHHYECGVLMYQTDCLADMKADFENLFEFSINMEGFKQKALTRMFCSVMKLFTPLL